MTTQEAIGAIHAPKGMTSILAGISTGDFSVLPHEKGKNADLEKAAEMVKMHQKQLDECKSDWAYWSILGDLSYWQAIHNILEAGELVGNNNLPYVAAPNTEGCVVMDAIGKVADFGKEVLDKAKKLKSEQELKTN